MSQQVLKAAAPVLKRMPLAALLSGQTRSTAEILHQKHQEDDAKIVDASASNCPAEAPRTQTVLKSFNLHIGADLKIPTVDKRKTHVVEVQPQLSAAERAAASDPFAGLPLKAWADSLGERVAPAFQAVQEEQRRSNLAAAKLSRQNQPLAVPQVPHLFPITRWAAQNETVQKTLVAEDSKKRQKARLSWYHPDDTMVPRGWWKMGLLEDLKYYRPFMS
ncbi:hypothetical protein ABBQ32_006816 [Trebouxia sp. C0010 RCD-2024]